MKNKNNHIVLLLTVLAIILFGTFLIYRTGALRVNYETHKKWIWVLFYGYFFYAFIHALFIYLAIGSI